MKWLLAFKLLNILSNLDSESLDSELDSESRCVLDSAAIRSLRGIFDKSMDKASISATMLWSGVYRYQEKKNFI
jgi:hypothetical protein